MGDLDRRCTGTTCSDFKEVFKYWSILPGNNFKETLLRTKQVIMLVRLMLPS